MFYDTCREDDKLWPMPDRVGRQELEIVMGNEHISFTVSRLSSVLNLVLDFLTHVIDSKDRLISRRTRKQGSRRTASLLLSDSGSKVSGVLVDFPAF